MRWSVFLELIRFRRQIGTVLLFFPCLWGLYGGHVVGTGFPLTWTGLFFIGAFLMRSAGCIVNDFLDRDFDGHVTRTQNRPFPSGRITPHEAFVFIGILLILALIVLLQFPKPVIISGFLSLGFVVLYPLMKRWTHWPQLFLGLAFNWGVWMGGMTAENLTVTHLFLYVGGVCWTIGYDTLYALTDRDEDRALGLKSTAIYFGNHVRLWIGIFYGAMALCILGAFYTLGFTPHRWTLWILMCGILGFQIKGLDADNSEKNAALFQWNGAVGALIAGGCWGD